MFSLCVCARVCAYMRTHSHSLFSLHLHSLADGSSDSRDISLPSLPPNGLVVARVKWFPINSAFQDQRQCSQHSFGEFIFSCLLFSSSPDQKVKNEREKGSNLNEFAAVHSFLPGSPRIRRPRTRPLYLATPRALTHPCRLAQPQKLIG